MRDLEVISDDNHINFENDVRQMFVGQTIRGVIYGELKYFDDECEIEINPEPVYKTKYPEIDSIDCSIYLKTDNESINIFWDNTFSCYGLKSKLLDLEESTNASELKLDVSGSEKWVGFLNQKIAEFNLIWKKTWTPSLIGTKKDLTVCPQTFEIIMEDGKSIYITASELKGGEEEYYSQMDNLLVVTSFDLLNKLEAIEQAQVGKYYSRKSVWSKVIGK